MKKILSANNYDIQLKSLKLNQITQFSLVVITFVLSGVISPIFVLLSVYFFARGLSTGSKIKAQKEADERVLEVMSVLDSINTNGTTLLNLEFFKDKKYLRIPAVFVSNKGLIVVNTYKVPKGAAITISEGKVLCEYKNKFKREIDFTSKLSDTTELVNILKKRLSKWSIETPVHEMSYLDIEGSYILETDGSVISCYTNSQEMNRFYSNLKTNSNAVKNPSKAVQEMLVQKLLEKGKR